MVDTPNDALQSHKVSGQNSPRGRVSGQKSLKNSEILEKLSPGEGGGVLGWATTLGQCGISDVFLCTGGETHQADGQEGRIVSEDGGLAYVALARGASHACGRWCGERHQAALQRSADYWQDEAVGWLACRAHRWGALGACPFVCDIVPDVSQ